MTESSAAQKLRGGFYTPDDVATFLTIWVGESNPKTILEPSCGDGVFLSAISRLKTTRAPRVIACEINPDEADKARERISSNVAKKIEIHTGDFLQWFLERQKNPDPIEGVLGNPPFIRYQSLSAQHQLLADKVFGLCGMECSKHTNAWVPFVAASIKLLKPGGRLGMVLPTELLHIPHAHSLRRFLALECSRILVLDPQELWFDGTLQGVVLLLAEKKITPADHSHGVAVLPLAKREELAESPAAFRTRADFINGDSISGKWMLAFLTPSERALLRSLRTHRSVARFDELASVDVGIVTGANDFFLVNDETVRTHGLERWAHPMFGRSDLVTGLIYSKSDHRANRAAGRPTNFLWFDDDELDSLPKSVRDYLHGGERAGLTLRFKCRNREPWFCVPSVYTAPLAMMKRSHHFPKLVVNRAQAFTTDTAYRVKPNPGIAGDALAGSFLNSLTCLTAELEGRHYGGGVLELVPSEIERLLLPKPDRYGAAQLAQTNAAMRRLPKSEPELFLRAQDDALLSRLDLARADRDALHAAWNRLRHRRHRTTDHNAAAPTAI